MKKPKKQTYYAAICPICLWKTVGNWKMQQVREYRQHWEEQHYQMPIVKKEKR